MTLQPLSIPVWTWDDIWMDFVLGFSKEPIREDSAWVIMDRLSKSFHLTAIQMKNPMEKLAEFYVKEIIRFHEVPSKIMSDRDAYFTSAFWRSIQELRMNLTYNTTFHSQIDGQLKRTIQISEDML